MATKLDKVDRRYQDNTDTTNLSRYKRMWRIRDDEGDLYQETYDEPELTNRSDDQLHQVQPGEENRLDIVSNIYYSSPLYWWIIAQASEIFDPTVVPVGTILRIPSKQSLFGNKGLLV